MLSTVKTETCRSNAVLRRRNRERPARTQFSLNLVWHQRQRKMTARARSWSRINGSSISRTSAKIDSLRRPQKMVVVIRRRIPKEELLLLDQNLKMYPKFLPLALMTLFQSNFSKLTKWTWYPAIFQPMIYSRKLRTSTVSKVGRTCCWECNRFISIVMLMQWKRGSQISKSLKSSVKKTKMKVLETTSSISQSAPIARSRRDKTPENRWFWTNWCSKIRPLGIQMMIAVTTRTWKIPRRRSSTPKRTRKPKSKWTVRDIRFTSSSSGKIRELFSSKRSW